MAMKLGPDAARFRGPALLTLISGELRIQTACAEDVPVVMPVVEGDAIAVRAGIQVAISSRDASAELILLEMAESWADEACALAEVDRVDAAVPLFVERTGTPIARRLNRVLRELAGSPAGSGGSERLRCASKLLELLAFVFEERREVLEPGARRGGASRAALREAAERLSSDSLAEITLERFARQIGVSPRQVSRLFRQEFGMTFRDHLVELRLARAKELLERTQQSIVEVAGETGWSSLAHFNSVFRRRVGATPSGYRDRFAAGRAG